MSSPFAPKASRSASRHCAELRLAFAQDMADQRLWKACARVA